MIFKNAKLHLKVLSCPFSNIYSMATAKNAKKKSKNFYQILQVPSTAPQANIRKNFLKLAKIYHPDVYKGSDKGRFQNIQKAYQTLSNVKKRQEYDIQIGIKKSQKSAESINPEFTSEDSDHVYGKNDFQYTQKSGEPSEKIDLDAQYQKFFKKKKQTDFEEVRLHEQHEFKNMNEAERMRFRFRELYDNDAAQQKIANQMAFEKMIDDTIDQRNTHHQDTKKQKQKLSKLYSQAFIGKQKYLVYMTAILTALVFYPLLISFLTKHRQQKEEQQKIMRMMERLQRKKKQSEIRSRFQY